MLGLFFNHVSSGGPQGLGQCRTDLRKMRDVDRWTEPMDRTIVAGQRGRREDLETEGQTETEMGHVFMS